jgi:autotransporter-associated beta strand protein
MNIPTKPFRLLSCALSFSWVLLLALATNTYAGSATWNVDPTSDDWNTATDWTPTTVPNGSADTATFAVSSVTNLTVRQLTEVDGIIFAPEASAFKITPNANILFTISGAGISNQSGVTQKFSTSTREVFSELHFTNSATAGTNMSYTDNVTCKTSFFDTASADSASFTNNGGSSGSAVEGSTEFFDEATAGSAIFTNNSTVLGGNGGLVAFNENSNAGSGTFTNHGARTSAGYGSTTFSGLSSAANATFINEGGIDLQGSGGYIAFWDSSTAGDANFQNQGGTVDSAGGALIEFNGSAATAGNATFSNQAGGANGAGGGRISFVTGDGGSAVITNNGGLTSAFGAYTTFCCSASAANSTLIANGGTNGGLGSGVQFLGSSSGGTARLEVFGNGSLDISLHDAPGVTIGSLEGSGAVLLGANQLVVGTNNLTTTFSGVIEDGGQGANGSISKTGTGTLALSGANTFTGGTTVNSGTLKLTNGTGSGTGTGAVLVNGGTLGGKGQISGVVTIGTGSGAGAVLASSLSSNQPARLTLRKALTLKADSIYAWKFNTNNVRGDQVIAKGVTIETGAQFRPSMVANRKLPVGTVFTAISNTASTPISGVFAGFPDGSTWGIGNNNGFLVNYEGGDGNDLTFTVIP